MAQLTALTDAVLAEPHLARALSEAGATTTLEITGPAGLRPFTVAGLARTGRTVLAVTATSREAEDLVAELGSLMKPERIAYFPSWETLKH